MDSDRPEERDRRVAGAPMVMPDVMTVAMNEIAADVGKACFVTFRITKRPHWSWAKSLEGPRRLKIN